MEIHTDLEEHQQRQGLIVIQLALMVYQDQILHLAQVMLLLQVSMLVGVEIQIKLTIGFILQLIQTLQQQVA